jgi:hypothetical protein
MPRYPLHAVATLRRAARAKAEAELARADQALHEARERAHAIDRSLREHLAQRPRIDAGEAPVGALELQRASAFERRHRERSARLRAELQAQEVHVIALEQALARARQALAQALADERVVERDHERFLDGRAREREQAEQDELDEQSKQRP